MTDLSENEVLGDLDLPLDVPALPFPALTATLQDLYDERARRLAGGFDFDFGDDRGVHRIGTTDGDMIGWNEVTTLAGALVAAGQPNQSIIIVTDTGVAEVTAAEWQQILIAAAGFRQPIWGASFALQALDPLPEDFRADSYWS